MKFREFVRYKYLPGSLLEDIDSLVQWFLT